VDAWTPAATTYSTNFPDAKVLNGKAEEIDPLEALEGQKVDLLLSSPECTNHSPAKGVREHSEASRCTALQAMSESILSAPYFHNEKATYFFIEAWQWPNGPVCPPEPDNSEQSQRFMDTVKRLEADESGSVSDHVLRTVKSSHCTQSQSAVENCRTQKNAETQGRNNDRNAPIDKTTIA